MKDEKKLTNVESLKYQILSAMQNKVVWDKSEAYKTIKEALPLKIQGHFSEDLLTDMIGEAFHDLAEAMAKSTSIIIQIDVKDKFLKQSIGYCNADLG